MSQFNATPKVLHFSAPWHPSHAQMSAVISALPSAAPSIQFESLNAETSSVLVQKFNVTVVPTFILLLGDSVIEKLEVADPAELTRKVMELKLKSESGVQTIPAGTKAEEVKEKKEEVGEGELSDDLKKKIQTLLTSAPILLLMKGTPSSPKCGFSRQTIEILQSSSIPFSSYNILENPDVRAGVKIFSEWPTYPQLYVKGELVGGLDIIKEMNEVGNLASELGVEATESMEEKLTKLVNRNNVMLFMKGLPSAPKCGFSRQIVEILEKEGVEGYEAFNILEDEEVRAELKKFG
ncbi:hypothetical protein TL16_g06192 [Triparma laevis f. inornata]|nr:hypothetical protein TL16_g06192 [Triparma laevis f. inornata]